MKSALKLERFGCVLLAMALTQPLAALGDEQLVVTAGKHERRDTLVSVPVKKITTETTAVELTDDAGHKIVGQVTQPAMLTALNPLGANLWPDVHFVLPKLEAGKTATFTVRAVAKAPANEATFAWHDTPGKSVELRLGKRPVLRYMYEAIDESSKERREETFKPYHHLFSPDGSQLVTKGPGGLFPHHRGLFYGFNKISYGEGGRQQADTWHCNKGEWQAHVEIRSAETGPLLGRHRVLINWHGRDKKVFAEEERELTAYSLPGGTLVEFASLLVSKVGKIKLDGDPQHAGFQFRTSQEVPDKTKAQTYYLRPDGRDKPGSFRNWSPKDPSHENLPWLALSFVVGDKRYTALYMDHPQNPKPARYSERDYGRFGCYFEKEIDPGRMLGVRYRLFFKEGEMTVEEAAAIARDFSEPVTVAAAR